MLGGTPPTRWGVRAGDSSGDIRFETRVTAMTYDKYGRAATRTLPDPDGAGSKPAPVWTYAYYRGGE